MMSFHACGPNVGDEVDVPLPSWVLDEAKRNPSLLYRDQHGYHNPECLSLWADDEPLVLGRTPLQCYADFMASFRVRSPPSASLAAHPSCATHPLLPTFPTPQRHGSQRTRSGSEFGSGPQKLLTDGLHWRHATASWEVLRTMHAGGRTGRDGAGPRRGPHHHRRVHRLRAVRRATLPELP